MNDKLTPDITDTIRSIQESEIKDQTARQKIHLELHDAKFMLGKVEDRLRDLHGKPITDHDVNYHQGRESMLRYWIIRLEGLLR